MIEQLLRDETEAGLSQLSEVELFSALSRRVRMRESPQCIDFRLINSIKAFK